MNRDNSNRDFVVKANPSSSRRVVGLVLVLLCCALLLNVNRDISAAAFDQQNSAPQSETQVEASANYERVPVFKASELLKPEERFGPHFQVVEEVTNDGYTNIFNINSSFGLFNAYGYQMLKVRLQEIDALAKLQEVSKSQEFGKAMARSAIKPVKGAIDATRRPIATAKGVPSGIKRLFGNLSHEVKQGIKDVNNDGDAKSDGEAKKDDSTRADRVGEATKNAAVSFFGVSASMRRWAEKLNVDPYSTNEVLNNELERIAWVDAAGDIAKSFVVPSIPGVGTASDVNSLVWGNDPQALYKINEDRLFKMGVESILRSNFLENPAYTPTLQTEIVASLFGMENVDDRQAFIQMAVLAKNESEARFYQESAKLLAAFHSSQHKFKYLISDLQVTVARTIEGDLIVLLPADYLSWTAEFNGIITGINKQSQQPAAGRQIQLWLPGKVSATTRRQLTQLGWTVNEDWHYKS